MLSVTMFAEVSTFPVTANDDNVPTDVTLGCAAVVKEPATVVKSPNEPDTLPVVTLPVTANEVRVPVDVMFG